jgi:methylase of polypeptide subunit release factors
VDVGTGSGVISLSIAAKRTRELQFIAVDKSEDALDLAQENLGLLKNPLKNQPIFLQGDLLIPLIRHMNKNTLDTLLITANLPYVLTREVV